MSDALEDCRGFRVLNIIDDLSRECLAAVVDTSMGGARVARVLPPGSKVLPETSKQTS